MDPEPTPRVAARPVDVVLVVDTSGSMLADARMQSLNAAMEEAVPFLRQAAAELVEVAPSIRVLTVDTTAAWAVADPVPLSEFWWPELQGTPGGLTELGLALAAVRDAPITAPDALPPVVMLLTDGRPTDTADPDFAAALATFDRHPVWGGSARVAVGIGADADRDAMEAFVAATQGEVVGSDDAQRLADVVRLAGTTALRTASAPVW